jgi:hypothetical protein
MHSKDPVVSHVDILRAVHPPSRGWRRAGEIRPFFIEHVSTLGLAPSLVSTPPCGRLVSTSAKLSHSLAMGVEPFRLRKWFLMRC